MNRTSPRPRSDRANARRLRRRKRALRRRLVLAGILLAIVFIIILIISNIGGTNAVALYLGEERFAYIDVSGEVTEAEIMAEAVRRLEAVQGAEVRVSDEITLREVGRTDQDILQINEVIERLIAALEFQIVGFAIVINGDQTVILRNQQEVDEVIWNLQSAFVENRERYSTIEFIEDFETTRVTVDASQLVDTSYALLTLGRSVVEMVEYVVQPGENLSIIAARYGVSLAQAFADNPHIPSSGELSIGEVLQIQQTRPHLSVRTVEEITRREYIEIEDIERPNPGAPVGFYEIITQGERGEQEIVSQIIRINGVQQSAEDIATRPITDMVQRVIEVGTGD